MQYTQCYIVLTLVFKHFSFVRYVLNNIIKTVDCLIYECVLVSCQLETSMYYYMSQIHCGGNKVRIAKAQEDYHTVHPVTLATINLGEKARNMSFLTVFVIHTEAPCRIYLGIHI